jgi:uncharacterized membrane protein YphA (DoxX/SURF4 family)
MNDFFHARAGPEACVLGGWMRIGYALLFIYDRIIIGLDFEWFFSGNGVISFEALDRDMHQLSIFQLAPNSEELLWAMHYIGLLHGILLLLGIAPRFQVVCLFVNLVSFHHHNSVLYDAQDVMMRIWAILFCFMPLHRLTIYELFQNREETKQRYKNDAWPMWPFRLWQIQMCFIYPGAGLAKLVGQPWRDGTALYLVMHTDDFYGGVFNPDIIFNRLGSLKFLTWSSLLLENICWMSIWPQATRMPTLVSVILFHVGIELSMDMHTFQWNTILGWLVFLVKPLKKTESNNTTQPNKKIGRFLLNVFLGAWLTVYFINTFPMYLVRDLAPPALQPIVQPLDELHSEMHDRIYPFLAMTGTWQYVWSMFGGVPNHRNSRFEATISFRDGSPPVTWSSPDWKSMPWWLKKRHHRQMDFYDLVQHTEGIGYYEAFCQHLALKYGPNVNRVTLSLHQEIAPEPPADLGLWDPAKQEMWTVFEHVYTFHLDCDVWAAEGECQEDPVFMKRFCERSCQQVAIVDPKEVTIGSRLSVYFENEDDFDQVTVAGVEDNFEEFFLHYDDGSESEWIDLREHDFLLLRSSEAVEDASKHEAVSSMDEGEL